MRGNIYRHYFGLSSFKNEDFKEIIETYPFRLNIFHKFLEEVIILPFIVSPPHELKEIFPEGSIVHLGLGKNSKDTLRLVVIFGREKENEIFN